jgi:hypothetical protein
MVKLIRGLMQSGALNKDAGEALLAQAQAEAGRRASPSRRRARGLAQVQPGDVRVPYISQTVREQIRDEIKGKSWPKPGGGWAAPNEVPAWTKRIRVEGDVRARYESRFYDMANSNIEIDWRSLNSGSGYDVNSNTNLALPALLNTRQDRKNLLRARPPGHPGRHFRQHAGGHPPGQRQRRQPGIDHANARRPGQEKRLAGPGLAVVPARFLADADGGPLRQSVCSGRTVFQ